MAEGDEFNKVGLSISGKINTAENRGLIFCGIYFVSMRYCLRLVVSNSKRATGIGLFRWHFCNPSVPYL
jgi:hypothetical protein